MTTRLTTRRRSAPSVVGRTAVAVLLGLVLAGCGGDDEPAPYVRPTGSPFTVTITGPATAEAGETVTATVTNAGRLPDGYRLVPDPVDAVVVAGPDLRLAAGESAEVELQVLAVPVRITVESISGGTGEQQAVLSIGSQG